MQQIPMLIHYCWFGGNPKPQLVIDCIESWKKYCPDYEIREWNETNFDVNSVQYVKEAYEAKKWAFVSDYVRLYAMTMYGGIYLDTDVEILQPIDELLANEAFTGFEANDTPVTAIMGCAKGQPLFCKMLDYYKDRHFVVDGEMELLPNTIVITDLLFRNGARLNGKKQTVNGCTIYPEIVLCPNNIRRIFYKYSKKTLCVHHFMGSWGGNAVTAKRNIKQRLIMFLSHTVRNVVGTKKAYRLSCFIKGVKP